VNILEQKRDIPYKLLFTGQHKDIVDEIEYDFITLPIGNLDEWNESHTNRLNDLTCSIVSEFDFQKDIWEDVTHVLVQGDTASAFSIALATFHKQIPILHLEAGMRTNNNKSPFPEEFYRRSISVMADYHFCPTKFEVTKLQFEKIDGKKHIVGNTCLNNIRDAKTSCYRKKVLVTLHRRENHGIMRQLFEVIEGLAVSFPEYEFLLPMHPNPNVQKHKDVFKEVNVCEPLNHEGFIEELANCMCVITDSGGVQEESTFLGKKVFLCRKQNESERIDEFTTFIEDPQELKTEFEKSIGTFENYQYMSSPYGDGDTAEKVYEILKKII